MNLDFLVLIHIDIDDDLVLLAQVGHLSDLAGRLAETLVGKVSLDNDLDAVSDVGAHLTTLLEVKTLHEVLLLAALHAVIVHLGHARLLTQVEHQPGLVMIHLLDNDLHLGEQALTPKALSSHLEFLTGNLDALTNGQARVTDDDVLVIVVHTLDADARNLIGVGGMAEDDLWIIDGIVNRAHLLGARRQRPAQG